MARPTEYSPVILPVVKACAAFGATKDEIAKYLGISTTSLYNWQLEHKELIEALKRGEEASVNRVVETLYQLAVGWKGGKPDLGAICFYLKNKRPQEWRDVQNLTADVGHYILSNKPMSEDEWIAARTKTIESKANTGSNDVATELSPDNEDTARPLE